MQGVGQKLEQILRELEDMVPDIEAIVVVNDEGLTLASSVPLGLEEDKIAAMATIALSLSERTVKELEKGEWDHAIIRGTDGVLVVQALTGASGAIAVIASKDAKTGMIIYLVKRVAQKIVSVLEGGEGSESNISSPDINLPPL